VDAIAEPPFVELNTTAKHPPDFIACGAHAKGADCERSELTNNRWNSIWILQAGVGAGRRVIAAVASQFSDNYRYWRE
jgi:hypothetical protein